MILIVCNTSFQEFYSKTLKEHFEQHHPKEVISIFSTVNTGYLTVLLDIWARIRRLNLAIARNQYCEVLLPHIDGLIINYLYRKFRKLVRISFYYEGIALFRPKYYSVPQKPINLLMKQAFARYYDDIADHTTFLFPYDMLKYSWIYTPVYADDCSDRFSEVFEIGLGLQRDMFPSYSYVLFLSPFDSQLSYEETLRYISGKHKISESEILIKPHLNTPLFAGIRSDVGRIPGELVLGSPNSKYLYFTHYSSLIWNARAIGYTSDKIFVRISSSVPDLIIESDKVATKF